MSQTRKNLKYCTVDGFFSGGWEQLSGPRGFFIAGLLNVFFGVSPFWYGLIVAMSFWANALQVILVPLASRFMHVRSLTIGTAWFEFVLWIIGFWGIAFLEVGNSAQVGLFFLVLYACTALSSALSGVGWLSWLSDFVPLRIRGRYMGVRNRYTSLSALLFMGLSTSVLHWMDASRAAYLILVVIAMTGRLIAIVSLHLLNSPNPTGGALVGTQWSEDFRSLWKEKMLVRFVVFGLCLGFLLSGLATLCSLYIIKELEAPASSFAAYSMVAVVSGMFFVRVWGQLVDKHGCVPVMMLCLLVWRCGDIGMTFLQAGTRGYLFIFWIIGGAMGAGYTLAAFNLLLKLIPSSVRSVGISVHLMITSVAAALAPMMVGTLIDYAEGYAWDTGFVYRVCMIVAALLTFLSTALLWRMREPDIGVENNTLWGALRNLGPAVAAEGKYLLRVARELGRR